MMNKMMLMGIKQYMPEIKEKAGETINSLFAQLITDAEKHLIADNGEHYASIMAIKSPKGEVHLIVCALSTDDKILRVISTTKADEFTNQLLEKLL